MLQELVYYILMFFVPVAQLDRALASGAKDKKPQAFNNQEVTKPTEDVLSSCLAFSVSETIEKHPELVNLIEVWPRLSDELKQAIIKMIS